MCRVYEQQRIRDVSGRSEGPGRLHEASRLASAFSGFASLLQCINQIVRTGSLVDLCTGRLVRRVLGNAGCDAV